MNITFIKLNFKRNVILFLLIIILISSFFIYNIYKYGENDFIKEITKIDSNNEIAFLFNKLIIFIFIKQNIISLLSFFIIIVSTFIGFEIFSKKEFEYLYSMPINRNELAFSLLIINILFVFFIFIFYFVSFIILKYLLLNSVIDNKILYQILFKNFNNLFFIVLNISLSLLFFFFIGNFVSIIVKNNIFVFIISISFYIIFFSLFNFFDPETSFLTKLSPFTYNYDIFYCLKLKSNYIVKIIKPFFMLLIFNLIGFSLNYITIKKIDFIKK